MPLTHRQRRSTACYRPAAKCHWRLDGLLTGAMWRNSYLIMEFEFDPVKSQANLAKHGIDFVAAQALWDDAERIEVPARTTDESRWLVRHRCLPRRPRADHLHAALPERREAVV
jgi:hypothetical protein